MKTLTSILFLLAIIGITYGASIKEEQKEEIKLINVATFPGGITKGLEGITSYSCDVNMKEIQNYAAVSKLVYEKFNETICDSHYIVGMAAIPEAVSAKGSPMFKARIVDSCEECQDSQIIIDKNAFNSIAADLDVATQLDIIWVVMDKTGEIILKSNYHSFDNYTDFVGIPGVQIKELFEQVALDMVIHPSENDTGFHDWPWIGTETAQKETTPVSKATPTNLEVATPIMTDVDLKEESESSSSSTTKYIAASLVAGVGLAGLVTYRRRFSLTNDNESNHESQHENNLAIPSLPSADAPINSISDHPEGLPRVDIYDPPLAYYHFPMDTTYDIVDIRPDFYED